MKKKILSLLTAFAMVFGILVAPFTSASAAEEKTNTVFLHKLLMTAEELNAWKSEDIEKEGYDATQDVTAFKNIIKKVYENSTADDIGGVFFAVQNANGKYIGKDGQELTNQDIKDKDFKTNVLGGLTVKGTGLELDVSQLTQDKTLYKIVEIPELTTYKGDKEELLAASKAVPVEITLPITNKDGVQATAHVYPKNTQEVPKIDKNFSVAEAKKNISEEEATKLETAIQHKVAFDNAKKAYKSDSPEYKKAEGDYSTEDKELIAKWGIDLDNNQRGKQEITKKIGDDVEYVVETEIPKGARYKKLVWNDKMTDGLTYNKDLTIEGAGLAKDEENDDYFVTETDRGFTLVLKESGLKKVENAAKTADVTLKLKYTAKVNKASIVDKADENDIALDYSNKPGKDNEPEEFKPGKKEITVKKTWDITGDQSITDADAGVTAYFTLQKKVGNEWVDVETQKSTSKEEFTLTFTGLDENETYRVVESVKGYEAEYTRYNSETGQLEIKNHKDKTNPKKINPSEPKVVTGGKRFIKTNNKGKDEAGLERLAGAEFYVKNEKGEYLVEAVKDENAVKEAKTALDNAAKAYNKMTAKEQESEEGQKAKALFEEKQKEYNDIFVKNAYGYKWGAKTDDNVVILTSDDEGKFEIKGLAYGDNYRLEEKTAPEGYAKLADNEAQLGFKVQKGTYAGESKDLEYEKTVKTGETQHYGQQIKNKDITIPQTGGIGSLIFIVAGAAIMIGAFVAYKKSQAIEA